MPRPALSCTVKLKIKQVTCPGTLHLTDRNLVFITISIIAQTRRTKSHFASFPFSFNEKMVFQRIFTNARTLDHVLEILEDEIVHIELRQYSERYDGGIVLARFEQPTRQFLFPGPTFAPKDDIKREILLTRTSNFSADRGIDPKMEFYTSTKIEEATIASSSREHILSTPRSSSPRKKNPQKRLSKTPSSSDTEEEIIITTPRRGKKDRPTSTNTQTRSTTTQHCVCECPLRPENSGRVVIRSRSASPGMDGRKKSWYTKPPFKVGKAPKDLISRRNFDDETAKAEPSPRRSAGLHSCPNCLIPHPQCSLCMAYKQTYGSSFLRHRFTKDASNGQLRSSPLPATSDEPRSVSRVKIPKARARIPVSSPESSSDDEAYRAALTVASEKRRNRATLSEKRDLYKEYDRLSPGAGSPHRWSRSGQSVRSTVKGLLEKNDSVLQYDLSNSEDGESDDSEDEKPSFAEPPILTSSVRSLPDRSVVVPLSSEKYWSQRSKQFTGKSHRQVFNDSLGEIYKDIYYKTLESD